MKTIKEKIIRIIKQENFKTFMILGLMTIILSGFLYTEGIIKGADLDFHLNRIYEISENIKCGDILSLAYKNTNGYGSGLFYPQVFLYIPALLMVIGIDIMLAYKIFLFICNAANIFITFICVYKLSKNRTIGIATSLFYSTCCYRFAMTYWVAAVGMLEAFIFVPVIILGLYEIFYRDANKWYILVIGITGLVYSHLISFVLLVLFVCLPILLINIKKLKDRKIIKAFCLAILLTILLTSGFVIGFLEQIIKYDFGLDTRSLNVEPLDTLVPFPFNIVGIYNSKYNIKMETYMFYGMGVGSVIFVLSTTFIIVNIKKKYIDIKENHFLIILYILAFFYVFAICIRVFWEHVGVFALIQFPHRFQLINSFIFSLLAGYALHHLFKSKAFLKELALLIIILTMIFNFYYTYFGFIDGVDKYELNYMKDKGAGMEYLPASIKREDVEKVNKLPTAIDENIDINFEEKKGKYILQYSNNIIDGNIITLPIYYYDKYEIIQKTNEKDEIINNGNGYVSLGVYGEQGKIILKYDGTTLLKIGYSITILTHISIILWVLTNRYRLTLK